MISPRPARAPLPASEEAAPRAYPAQVDPTTCGIAVLSLLAARAGADPHYLDPDADVEAEQKRLHALAARVGTPWPQALGTSPWALARLARHATGRRHRIAFNGPGLRARIDTALASGWDVPVYTGGARTVLSALIPRHVVLILAHEGAPARYAVFEPSSGRVFTLGPDEFLLGADSARAALGHWRRVLFALVPSAQ